MTSHLPRHTGAVRLLIAAALAVSVAACESEIPPPLTPTPPGSTPIPPETPPLTVHGTVLEFRATGEQVPVANLRLKVRSSGGGGAVLATPLADTVTDEHGRYSIDIDCNPGCAVYFQPDPQSEYRFLCDWYPIPVRYFPGHSPLFYLPVVHKNWSGNRPPSGMLIYSGAWGIVSEQIAGSLQPVAGATVTLDGARADPPATTGPNGFFMICAMVGPGQGPRTLAAFKTGYNPVTRDIEEEAGGDVHLLLTRK